MKDISLTCRIWAHENTKGVYHSCHAESVGLAGHTYAKDKIENKLATAPLFIRGSTWEMLACEPNHDGKACESCPYRYSKGVSHFYDLKQQRESLRQAQGRGLDIRIIE